MGAYAYLYTREPWSISFMSACPSSVKSDINKLLLAHPSGQAPGFFCLHSNRGCSHPSQLCKAKPLETHILSSSFLVSFDTHTVKLHHPSQHLILRQVLSRAKATCFLGSMWPSPIIDATTSSRRPWTDRVRSSQRQATFQSFAPSKTDGRQVTRLPRARRPPHSRAGQIECSNRMSDSNIRNPTFETSKSIEQFDCRIIECSGRTLVRKATVTLQFKLFDL